MTLSPRKALIIFVSLVVFALAQAVWWIVFMARLTDEKVELVEELGGTEQFLEQIHDEEVSRQVMLGLEGSFFLVLLLVGTWLMYRALARTEQLKLQQENFLMAVTHELKTPLASIKLYLETLQSAKVNEENKRQVVPKIRRDLVRLEGLVENILEAGRFSRSAVRIQKTQFDLSELVGNILADFSDRAKAANITLETKVPPGIRIEADPLILKKSLEALLDNAAKYSPKDSALIVTELKTDNRQVELSVRDHGIGLEKNELEAIFQRFYRVGNELTRNSSGSGLGLYLTREMIRANGGEIFARSDGPGKGAEFVVRFPTVVP